MAGSREWYKRTFLRYAVFFMHVPGEGNASISSCGLEGRELPHAREQCAMAVQLAHDQSASTRIEQHSCGKSYLDRCTLLARGGQLFRDAELTSTAPFFDRTFSTLRRFRRAHGRAQLHHGLVPVAGSV